MKAKFIYTALLAVLFLSANIYSQRRPIELVLGVEGGINIGNFTGTPDPSSSSRTGLIAGASLEIGFTKNFAIQTGLRFIMKGAQTTGDGVVYVDKLNYLEIPALIRADFPLSEVEPYLLAGPVLGINMSANEDQTPNGGTTTTVDISNAISGTDFGLLFGGGVEFKLNKKIDLFAQFGYELGLSNILKNATNQTLKNTGIQLTAGVLFDL